MNVTLVLLLLMICTTCTMLVHTCTYMYICLLPSSIQEILSSTLTLVLSYQSLDYQLWTKQNSSALLKYLFISSFSHSFSHSFIHLLIPLFIQSFIQSFMHSFINSFIHLVIHSFSHSFMHSPSLVTGQSDHSVWQS